MDKRLKLLIAASHDTPDLPGFFQVKYGGEFAARKFLPHLTNFEDNPDYCSRRCFKFRQKLNLNFSKDIAGVIRFPSVLPELIDDAELYIKSPIAEHDILIAVGVHPDILVELVKHAAKAGCKAIIVPREDPTWLSSSFANKLKALCEQMNLEYAFPRPFCSLAKGKFRYINSFIDQFKIGRPKYTVFVDDNEKVAAVDVSYSSACGATYHVAAGLIGVDKEDVVSIANRLWHAYPCLSSSHMDPEICDSPMHIAAYINLNAAKDAQKNIRRIADGKDT
ncbi:hypothetical protein TSYNTROOL_08430 [Tepidanaerobacter syntrophicus]|uniref:Thymidylate synthase n=1 Tax=Tepidanaerobacter syntrophicus TaxID=224999 RepID=A0A0U9HET2_9FIRM|nr:DUF166 family protein [Tepidanaerobacter syntrophicus]GAQ25194.1 hypothetical protein TSYNT_7212 [Tepidanaerobacter syntrophicus]GLI50757.1 hypothetical protein TSYNTROOL_08430 [Tepidanaerobacter syntrophicus]HHV82324.1 hypothetical protein [Tepidanaerobacter syntrophicus]